ncbi:hypothetical protein HZS_3491 [Henneguya salminicola]|nr:hypothetical protein HZS_3491 [Henneguya salminicola]
MSDLYFKSSDFHRECVRALVGSVVITRYNNKTYRIDDIEWGKSPKDSFEWQNGKTITYIEYYKEVYGLEITDTDQPLLINIPKSTITSNAPNATANSRKTLSLICLIPEFCFLTGITDDMRSNFNLMKSLSTHIHCPASQRLKTIHSLVDLVHKNKKAQMELSFWGLTLSTSMHKVEGNLLNSEPIYAGNSEQPLATNTNGVWHQYLRNIKPLSCPRLTDWICLYTQRDSETVDNFMKSLQSSVRASNLAFSPPKMLAIPSDNTEAYIKAIRSELSQNPNLDLIMSIFPSQREDRYASFKKLLCCQTAIPSQAILTRTISNVRRLSVVANRVALQINCKLGGELWRVSIPIKSVMVIGIDVHHCTVSKARSSVVGLVSSLNNSLTRYYSRVVFQAQSEEMVQSLALFCSQALSKYYEINHELPKKIIIFRDGVGDGQIRATRELELEHILQALNSFSDSYNPELAYLLVRKRIRTRYFSENQKGEMVNPASGSVIDESITSSEFVNFYLVSQNFTQGTILPINIAVLYNNTNLSLEQIQRFTYKCTYLYFNWSGTVRVPAPCLYAHKVAFMAGQYLHSEPSPHLSDKLYYL